jgi:cell division protein FtsB
MSTENEYITRIATLEAELETLRTQNAALEERVKDAEQRAIDAHKREMIVRTSLGSPISRSKPRAG